MKKSDIFKMCRDNLFRRKARTFLSVLGVLIGSASIMMMLSIGVGMSRSQNAWIEDMGDLTAINVYPRYDNSEVKLDDAAVKSMRAIPGAAVVAPKVSTEEISFSVYAGKNNRYLAGWAMICGYDADSIQALGFELTEGDYPKGEYTALIGENFEYALMDTRRPDGNNMIEYYMYDQNSPDMPDPYVDLVGEKVVFTVNDENGNEVYTKEIKITGKLKADYSKAYETQEGIILQSNDLKRMLAEASKALGTKKNDTVYSGVTVKASSIDMVSSVQSEIDDMGFQTDSMESMRESTQKEMAKVQLALGGIGAISLLVAAIGITNTMIMSVSERTKEIGIMKALGCFVYDVRKVFLMEAAAIGFMGGIAGSFLSFAISCIINIVVGMSQGSYDTEKTYTVFQMIFTSPERVSVIPAWLFIFGIGFSVIIGLVSGMYPANKAVKISALEAMKNE